MRIERGPDPGPFPNHRAYKPHLRPLFRSRCAYCLTPDDRLGGEEGMTVDHFRPKGRYPALKRSWSNLYYACSGCNSHKRDFPRPEEEAQGKRFVDPCEEDPDEHFRLVPGPATGDRCQVQALSRAAEYVVFRLKLNRRKALRDFWRCIEHRELLALERQEQIRQRLEDCSELMRRDGANQELSAIQAHFQAQLTASLEELDAVRLLRPFPIG